MPLPEAFIQRIKTQKYINADELIIALEKAARTSIRINGRKWKSKPADSGPVEWCTGGFNLEKRPSFTMDPLFHAGCYYPQESSGMFLDEVFRQKVEKSDYLRVLDLCGAPGGKATHLSSLVGEDGFLVANDVIRSRAAVLAENLTKWGLGNTIVTRNDPAAFGSLEGFFDLVLVDAPCSGEGMFRDQVAVNEWSQENTILCSERQKRILAEVWPSLKDGGILIYSTCTFNPGENEENIKWLVSGMEAEILTIDISGFKGIREIDFRGIRGYGFFPGKIPGEGLFVSVLRKNGCREKSRVRIKHDYKFRPARDELKIAGEWILCSGGRMLKSDSNIIAAPCSPEDFSIIYENLRIVKPGTRIGSVKGNRFLPDHDLAMDINFRKSACPTADIDYNQAIGFLSRVKIELDNIPKGWINLRYKDVSLGFINNIGERLNNYYPLDWRIKMDKKNQKDTEIISWE